MLKTLEDNKELLQFNAEGVDPGEIWTEACVACKVAVEEFMMKHGEPLYCGFANVKIRPARGSFVKFLKRVGIGSLGYKGGWRVSYYDMMDDHKMCSTQSMDLKEEGCQAFVNVLKKYGIEAYMESRAD
jgi:hypothetical protein